MNGSPLPHGFPALRVDRVLEQAPGRARVLKLVSAAEGELGEAWLLEFLAQGSAYITGEPLGSDIRVAAFQEVELLDLPVPGDRLEADLRSDGAFGILSRVQGAVTRGGQVLCRAVLVLARART